MASKPASKGGIGRTAPAPVFEMYVSVLARKEKGGWAAVALEMDIWGYGATYEKALADLRDLVAMQITFAIQKGQPEMIYKPAEPQYLEIFHRVRAEVFRSVANPPRRPKYRAMGMPISAPPDQAPGFTMEHAQA